MSATATAPLSSSHDAPRRNALTLSQMLDIYCAQSATLPLALNIKSDGLYEPLRDMLAAYGVEDYFVFDMSIPDTIGYLRGGHPVFTRQSDYERTPLFYSRSSGIWLDAFEEEWTTSDVVDAHLAAGKRVCVVSPELHRRLHCATVGGDEGVERTRIGQLFALY